MITRRCVVLAVALLAGCATQTQMKHSASSAGVKKPQAQPAPPADEPKWEAVTPPQPTLSASDLLAQKAAEYAKAMQSADGASPAPAGGTATALLAGSHDRRSKKIADPLLAPVVVPSVKPEDPAPTAQVASARVTPSANPPGFEPQIVPESADFQSPLSRISGNDPLGDRLRKRLAQNPRDIAEQLDLQLYGMLNEDPVAELAAVSALPDDDREMIAALVDGLSNFRSTVRQNGNMLTAQKIKPLLEMADRLRSQADLTVSTVALCNRVEAYGKYTPISPARFPAGQSNAAIVYCEVENFQAKQNSAQLWQTHLSEKVTMYTDQGMRVWSDTEREVTDECRNRRHDFFAYNVIHMPANLTIGRYMLKVSIEDKNANHVAESTVPLSIVGQ